MNISYSSLSQLHGELSIDLLKSDFQPKIKSELKRIRQTAQVKGFRQGHVPESMVQSMYGSAIKAEVINKLVNELVNNYQKDNNVMFMGDLLPITEPLTDEQFNADSIELKFEVGKAPEIDIDKIIAGLTISSYQIGVDEKVVNDSFDDLRERNKENVEVDSPIELNDMVELQVVELEGSAAKEGGVVSDFFVTVDHIITDELKDLLIGKSNGFQFEVDINLIEKDSTEKIVRKYLLKIPDENTELSYGSMFSATISKVMRKQVAVIDENFYSKVFGQDSEVKSESAALEFIKKDLEKYYQEQSEQIKFHEIIRAINHDSNIELPDEFLKKWLKVNFEEWNSVTDQHEFDHKYYHYRETMIWRLVRDRIFVEKGLQVQFNDVQQSIIRGFKAQYPGIQLQDEQWQMLAAKSLENKEELQKHYDTCQTEKVLEWIAQQINSTDKPISIEEYKEIVKKLNSHDGHVHHHDHHDH